MHLFVQLNSISGNSQPSVDNTLETNLAVQVPFKSIHLKTLCEHSILHYQHILCVILFIYLLYVSINQNVKQLQ